jgi:hypothetical protein
LLNVESYLLKYDLPNLPLAVQARLKGWLAGPGAALAGLDGIPIAGYGELSWLYARQRADPQDFLKPSPLHALTALRLALGETQETALTSAFDLIAGGQIGSAWRQLDHARVCVFEDNPSGIDSLRSACLLLEQSDIRVETEYFGIARNPLKNRSLRTSGARVLPTLVAALRESLLEED